MTLQECLGVLHRRRKTMVVALVVVLAVVSLAMFMLVRLQSGTMTVQSRLAVMGQVAERQYYSLDTATAANEISLALVDSAKAEAVLADVRTRAGVTTTIPNLRSSVKVRSIQGAPILQIETTGKTADEAERLNVASLAILIDMAESLSTERLTGDAGVTTRVIMDPVPQERESLPVLPIAAFALLLAIAIAVVAALLRDLFDSVVRDTATVARRSLGLPVISTPSAARARVVAAGEGSTVLVAGVTPGPDSSEAARVLAAKLAAWGRAVVLVSVGEHSTDLESVRPVDGEVVEVTLGGEGPLSENLSPSRYSSLRKTAGEAAVIVLAADPAAWGATVTTLPDTSCVIFAHVAPGRSRVADVDRVAEMFSTQSSRDVVFYVD